MLPEIKVKIGADTSGLEKGISSATSSLGKFAKQAAVALGVAGAAGGFVAMTKAAIDNADALGKAAQKMGITVEALSRLQYAAQLSDVSLQGLQVGINALSRQMAAGSDAFNALGIAVKNSDGTLRSSVQVLGEIADRFAAMENGTTKTAIALDIFGRSGAELIPLLNAGSAGLADMAAQADRVGATISGSAAVAAEQFNDTLTQISATVGGVFNRIAGEALPSLQALANTLASPEFAQASATLATNIIGAFNAVTQAIVTATNAVDGFLKFLGGAGEQAGPLLNQMLPGEKLNFADKIRNASQNPMDLANFYAGMGLNPDGTLKVAAPTVEAENPVFVAEIDKLKEHHATIQTLEKDHVQKVSGIRREGQNQDLQYMGQFFSSVGSIMESGGNEMLGLAKAFGSAQALINTFVAGSQALADPTVPFWGKAAAFASMIATGLSAVSSIKSASKNSTGGGAAAASASSAAAPAMNRTLTVQGITPGQIFSGDAMRDFMEQMLQMQRDGYQVVLA